VGRPEALLPWLEALTATLAQPWPIACPLHVPAAEAFFTLLVHVLLTDPTYARHAAALQANPSLQQRVANCLLQRCLPALAAEAGSDAGALLHQSNDARALMQCLAELLGAPSLQPAVARRLRQPGAAELVRHAADIVRALPARRPGGVAADAFANVHTITALLLACLLAALTADQPPGGSSSGGGGGGGGSGSSSEQAAWGLVKLAPHLAACIRGLEADGECQRCQVAALCSGLEVCLRLVSSGCGATPAQLEAWADAAEALVRLQPLLVRLREAAEEEHRKRSSCRCCWMRSTTSRHPACGSSEALAALPLRQQHWAAASGSCTAPPADWRTGRQPRPPAGWLTPD
jgi:hypothetical protein